MGGKPHIVVLGNEKGGTGKSTVAMHIISNLLYDNHKVGSIDTDARQGTLSRYVSNRKLKRRDFSEAIPVSEHFEIFRSERENRNEAQKEDESNLLKILEKLKDCDYVVIDTPGNDTYLSRAAHSLANTLITPINDSFIDLDMIVRLDNDANILKPSIYAEVVWERKKEKAKNSSEIIDWIVLRNRMSNIYSRNKNEIERVLNALSKRIGFRLVTGFSDRVIFKELFLQGLTLNDLDRINVAMQLSHVAARNELNHLFDQIFYQKKAA